MSWRSLAREMFNGSLTSYDPPLQVHTGKAACFSNLLLCTCVFVVGLLSPEENLKTFCIVAGLIGIFFGGVSQWQWIKVISSTEWDELQKPRRAK